MSIPALPSPKEGSKPPASSAKASPLKQGPGRRSYANFRSALSAVRLHSYYSLVAVVGIFIGTTVAVMTSLLVRSIGMGPHVPVYTHAMMFLLIGIAGVSSIGGGLVMMNTLLAGMNERSLELSIRLAVGARKQDIRAQIAWEALLLSTTGGVIGCTCGLLCSFAFLLSLHLPLSIDPVQIVVLVSVSIALGVVFALPPVLRAAQVDYGKVLR